jgi:hypothetical protein
MVVLPSFRRNRSIGSFSGSGVPVGFPAETIVSRVDSTKTIDYLGTVRGRFGYSWSWAFHGSILFCSLLVTHQYFFAVVVFFRSPIVGQSCLPLVPFRDMREGHSLPSVPFRPCGRRRDEFMATRTDQYMRPTRSASPSQSAGSSNLRFGPGV